MTVVRQYWPVGGGNLLLIGVADVVAGGVGDVVDRTRTTRKNRTSSQNGPIKKFFFVKS